MENQSFGRKIYAIFRMSLNGEQRDYTQGNLPKAIILLAIPMILEFGLESVFAVVDIFFVSKLGPHAIATVGLTESVISLVYSIAIGLSTAATAVVARRIGEKNRVHSFHDVAGDFEKVPFVFQRDQCLARAVIHGNLQRLGQGPHRLDVPLDAQVAEDDEARLDWQSL